MIKFEEYMSYNEYISTAKEEEILFIDKLYEQGKLFEDELNRVKEIKRKVKLLVITDTFCKDSATIVPFLIKLANLNPKIDIKFLKREGNEELLEKLSGKSRIPTILRVAEDNEVDGKFIEFPQIVERKIKGKSDEEKKAIVEEMRRGKYNKNIQEEIIKLLLKE